MLAKADLIKLISVLPVQ